MPDRFYIDKEDRQYYEKVEQEGHLNFKDKSQKEQFLLAMAVGFENEQKRALGTKDGFFFSSYMGSNDRALVNAVAINERGAVDVLADEKEVFSIAEQYASAGIRLLCDAIKDTQFGTFDRHFEKELFDNFSQFCGTAEGSVPPKSVNG